MTNIHEIPELQYVEVRDGIALKPLDEDDGSRILEILSDDPTIRHRVQFAAEVKNKSDFLKKVESYRKDAGHIRYSIEENSRCVGYIALWRFGEFLGMNEPDTYGFGYFMDPAERGKNVVPDALKALMGVAMRNLNVEKFIAFCEDDNEPSQRVLKKAGFAATGEVVHFENTGWTERRYERIVETN